MKISRNNKIVKLTKSLHEKKYRDKNGMFLLEGPHLIEEALRSKFPLEYVIFSSKADKVLLSLIEKNNISSFYVDEKTMESISDTENNQGLVAVALKKHFSIEDLRIKKDSIFVLCDGIQDPGNLGTILRTSAAINVSAIILSNDCVDLYNPKTIRSSSGAIFHVICFQTDNFVGIIRKLEKNGVDIFCSESVGGQDIYTVNLKSAFAVIIGNEGAGVKQQIKDLCKKIITIPLAKNIESLNAAISCAVILFEAYRQRKY